MSEANDPDYKWRPATKGDIGSVARFGDFVEGPFSFGILNEVRKNDDDGELCYVCDFTKQNEFLHYQFIPYAMCQIQYDANKEP
jgi:hypothetical protein